jgi:hypothetical protein
MAKRKRNKYVCITDDLRRSLEALAAKMAGEGVHKPKRKKIKHQPERRRCSPGFGPMDKSFGRKRAPGSAFSDQR